MVIYYSAQRRVSVDFWEFFLLLVVFIPLAIIWVAAVFDLFKRHDLSGVAKALWLLAIVLVPVVGVVVYLIFRPKAPVAGEPMKVPYDQSVAQDLSQLKDLHDKGAISDEEYGHAKSSVLYDRTLG
jgi:predicted membrane channel-forming protein YqfA (hemolysin III family)